MSVERDVPCTWLPGLRNVLVRSHRGFAEIGASGEAADVMVACDGCDRKRPMVEAFGEAAEKVLPPCRGRRPHLRHSPSIFDQPGASPGVHSPNTTR